jgi:hypothetical protein
VRLGFAAALAGLLTVGVACSSSDDGPGATAPVPTTPSTEASETTMETLPSIPPVSSEPLATIPSTPNPTSPPSSDLTSARYLPDELGMVVESAPGVDTPGEITELIDNVWFFVPSEGSPTDPNVVPPGPDDRDILVAYARAQAAYHEQASTDPVPVEPSANLSAAVLDGGTRLSENIFRPRNSAGQHLNLDQGIVLRPVVIADPRSDTEAFIFDCQLDGTVFVNSDGSVADGQVPGVKEFPQIASVVKRDGVWIVDRLTRDERACV